MEPALTADAVLVCGVGSIGRECLSALHRYGVPARALDTHARDLGEPTPFTLGDCREPEALTRAGIARCRAVVLVCGDVHANVEGALLARRLNPGARLVVRTDGDAWGALLAPLLGDFVAFEPNRLAAGSLALAALATEMLGHFRIDGALQRVVRHRVASGDAWSGLTIDEAHERGVVVLDVTPDEPRLEPSGDLFFRYDPEHEIRPGDVLTLLARGPAAEAPKPSARTAVARAPIPALTRSSLVVIGATAVVLLATLLAIALYPAADATLSRSDAFFTALVLMTGGTYADIFPAFHRLSDAMRFFSVSLSVIGTVGAGLVYAWLTDRLLTARFQLPKRRRATPAAGHVVVVGLGRVGRNAIDHLAELGYEAAAIELGDVDDHTVPDVAVVRGNGAERGTLGAARLAAARGLVAATDSDWVNFEIALHARAMNPEAAVVLRARDPRFSDNVRGALPNVRVLCVPLLAAKAFAAAAMGESVIDLFQLGPRTVFVIEYVVAVGDTLDGELVSSLAEGYAVVPAAYGRAGEPLRPWSPLAQTRRLAPGDRLVVLGPSRSLQAIERRASKPATARVVIERLAPIAESLGVARVLAQHLGYTLEAAQRAAKGEGPLPDRLYPHQAHRIVRELARIGAVASVQRDPG